MLNLGYIKDYRKELDSLIWAMPPLYHRTWQYLKYKVNHKENEIPFTNGDKLMIKVGQHLTSIRTIAKNVGWYEGTRWKEPNPKTISKILNWLEKNEMITVEHGKGNKEYTLVTINNWERYQSEMNCGNTKVTEEKQKRNKGETDKEHSVDINNNDKKCINNVIKMKKNDKKEQYALNVHMTKEEFKNLLDKFGEEKTTKMIKILDNYKGAHGKKYESDYDAILLWVVGKVSKDEEKSKDGINNKNNFNNYPQRDYDFHELEKKLLGWE